jgi:putative transcriptional regulator
MVQKGTLLLSDPFLGDPNFERAVILICEHAADGTFGLVLNKETEFNLNDVVDVVHDFPLFVGGPVDRNTLHFVYKDVLRVKNSVKIKDGLLWGGEFEELKSIISGISKEQNYIRFFVGYAGWALNQLDEEIAANSWITYSGDIKNILSIEPANMWRTILKSMGGKHKEYANYPIDPRLN